MIMSTDKFMRYYLLLMVVWHAKEYSKELHPDNGLKNSFKELKVNSLYKSNGIYQVAEHVRFGEI